MCTAFVSFRRNRLAIPAGDFKLPRIASRLIPPRLSYAMSTDVKDAVPQVSFSAVICPSDFVQPQLFKPQNMAVKIQSSITQLLKQTL